jgi:hypothetical protein
MSSYTSIGIRATPHEIHYTILNGSINEFEISTIDSVVVPKALRLPEQLKYIRNTFADIINESSAVIACIRTVEPTAQKISIHRTYFEGVLQELIASSTIAKYYTGHVSSISSKLSIPRADFKLIVSSSNYEDIEIWKSMSPEARESFLAARSAFNI